MHRFLIIIEKANGNYSAYCPDLPDCVATGKTKSEAAKNVHSAVEYHIAGIRENNLPIPEGVAEVEYIAISSS